MDRKLNDLLVYFRRTGNGRDSLVSGISIFVYGYPKGKEHCSEEDCAACFLSFYPRIQSLLVRYRDVGRNFDAYLNTCLRWHLKTYLKQRIRNDRKEKLLLMESYLSQKQEGNDGFDAFEAGSSEVDAGEATDRKPGAKHILLLTLKSVMFLSDHAVEHIAILADIHRDFLFHIVEILRFTMRKRLDRIARLTARRNRNYFRIRFLSEEKHQCQNPDRIHTIDRQIADERKRYERTTRDIGRVPKSPTHRDIARILGLPKGSVDSRFYYLKKYMRRNA